MNRRPILIFWREVPIDVDIKTYEYISSVWGNDVYCYCFNDLPNERKEIGFNNKNIIMTITIKDNKNVVEIIRKYKDAIHIVGGFRRNMFTVLKELRKNHVTNVGIICEMPNYPCSKIKNKAHKLYSALYYNMMNALFSNTVKCFCTMGEDGVAVYNKIGWKKEKLYPYMYCSGDKAIENQNLLLSNPIKFVYIGRFDKVNKGVDCLIEAIKLLPKKLDIQIDFVGGYGDLLNEVVKLSKENEYVNFVGKWESSLVVNNLASYDVCIVPSRYDGWNLSANHSINSEIGCIITREAGSSELVKYAGNGIIIKSNDIEAIKNSIIYVSSHPEIVNSWKKSARSFQSRISSESVGNYFIDILKYSILNEDINRPCAPWLKEKI